MVDEFSDLEERYDSFYAPAFEIDIDGGGTFSTAEGQVSSVTVSTGIEKINRVTFTVAGVFDSITGDFTGVTESGLTVGNGLTVELGYGSETEPVMTGEITDVKPSFPEGDQPTVDVVGHDYRYVMGQSSGDESWGGTDLDSATEMIAKKYGFRKVEIGDGGPPSGSEIKLELERLVQDAESDIEFLWRLVDEFDYEMFSSAGVLRFRRPKKDGSPRVSLTYGRGLRSFRVTESSGKSSVGTVKHKGTNHYTGEKVEGTSERPEGADEVLLMKAAMESNEEAARRSDSKATEIDRQRRSTATTIGVPDLQIGDWVELDGLGCIGDRRFNGKYYIMAVNHDIAPSGYTTTATISGPTETNQQ